MEGQVQSHSSRMTSSISSTRAMQRSQLGRRRMAVHAMVKDRSVRALLS